MCWPRAPLARGAWTRYPPAVSASPVIDVSLDGVYLPGHAIERPGFVVWQVDPVPGEVMLLAGEYGPPGSVVQRQWPLSEGSLLVMRLRPPGSSCPPEDAAPWAAARHAHHKATWTWPSPKGRRDSGGHLRLAVGVDGEPRFTAGMPDESAWGGVVTWQVPRPDCDEPVWPCPLYLYVVGVTGPPDACVTWRWPMIDLAHVGEIVMEVLGPGPIDDPEIAPFGDEPRSPHD